MYTHNCSTGCLCVFLGIKTNFTYLLVFFLYFSLYNLIFIVWCCVFVCIIYVNVFLLYLFPLSTSKVPLKQPYILFILYYLTSETNFSSTYSYIIIRYYIVFRFDINTQVYTIHMPYYTYYHISYTALK